MPPPVRTAARRGWCLFGGRYPPVGGTGAGWTLRGGFPPGPGRGIQAFSRESPDAKSRGGYPPAPPSFMARSLALARFGVVGHSRTVVVFSCNHFRALIWGLSFAKMLFSIFSLENASQIGLSISEVIAPLSYQNNDPKNQRVGTSGHNTWGPGAEPRPSFSPFLGRNGDPRRAGGATGRCAPRPGRATPTPRVRSTILPPPGTGKPPRPVV